MNHRTNTLALALALAQLAVTTTHALAEEVTLRFTGTVNEITFADADLTQEFALGEAVDIFLTYEDTVEDSSPSNWAEFLDAFVSMSGTIDDYSFNWTSPAYNSITYYQNSGLNQFTGDHISVHAEPTGASVDGSPLAWIAMQLSDTSNTVFPGNPQAAPPPLSERLDYDLFNEKAGQLQFYEDDTPGANRVIFTIENVEVIEQCAADLNADGNVDVTDLLALLGAWGSPIADLDGDNNTSVTDMLVLLAAWGSC